ncbi:Ger(x)C family spore germination protein [Niallia taxi]|uniref:Ger(x)C family spore germination protein n=1 Tax=Niallia taxi TaxID=2499688 RepID=UPI0021A7D424|nr:Ger(x)C family spore germination protein [Niallia taxi]MCT2343715.1 Ger(x)C family spore germination protein [Niallia taxi]MDE5055581.1 Ger(x)C family spore germination protein [Niallia taxi]WOD62830.1 Ger(x)C family spore germination protein [Niallia taxi]
MKLFGKMLISVLVVFLLGGCWDRKELSEIKLVSGMAIDKGDDGKYEVTVEALNAAELNSRTSGGNAPSLVETIEGETLSEVSHQFSQYYAQYLVFSHMKLLVIGEDVAKSGMIDFIDYLERNRELRDDFKILIAKDSKASDVLKVTNLYRKSSSLKLSTQLENMFQDWGGDPDMRINDFINDVTLEGKEAVLNAVVVEGDKKVGATVENMNNVTPEAIVLVDSLGFFNKKKLAGFLPLDDTRVYLWITDKFKNTTLTVQCGEDEYSAVRIIHSTTDVQTKMDGVRPEFNINVKAEGYIEGTQCYKSLDKIETFKKYEDLVSKSAADKIQKTVAKMQNEYGLDIFGFGEIMRRQHNNQFSKIKEDWNSYFAEAKVNVNFDFILRRTGIRSDSFLDEVEK